MLEPLIVAQAVINLNLEKDLIVIAWKDIMKLVLTFVNHVLVIVILALQQIFVLNVMKDQTEYYLAANVGQLFLMLE